MRAYQYRDEETGEEITVRYARGHAPEPVFRVPVTERVLVLTASATRPVERETWRVYRLVEE